MLGVMQFDKPELLEKRIRLLEAIGEFGSITNAAKHVGLSYKASWEAIDTMNNLSHTPLVVKTTGGSGGGGTTLTLLGEEIVKNYAVLKHEYERFLHTLSSLSSFNMENIKHIQRIAMQISARNKLIGIIADIKIGEVNSQVSIDVGDNDVVVSTITTESVQNLGLHVGAQVCAMIKSSSIIIGK